MMRPWIPVVLAMLLAVPAGLGEHDDNRSQTECQGFDSNYDPAFDHDGDCVRNNRDRAAVQLTGLDFPAQVWLGQPFTVTGTVLTNEAQTAQPAGSQPDEPVDALTVLVIFDSNMVGASSRTAGVGFTGADGGFTASAVVDRTHDVTVPAGHVLFGQRFAAEEDVSWNNFNITRVELGPNPIVAWSYATDPVAAPGDPQYYDFRALDAQDSSGTGTGLTHRTHAVGRAWSGVQSVEVHTDTTTRFGTSLYKVTDTEELTVAVQVFDALGRAIEGQPVEVSLLGETRSLDTGATGTATTDYTVDVDEPGTYPLTATYAEEAHQYTAASTGDAQVLVRFPTSFELKLDPAETTAGGSTQVQGRLLDHQGAGVGGQTVRFTYDGSDLLDESGTPRTLTTAGDGSFAFTLDISPDSSVGHFPLKAHFDGSGDQHYLASSSEAATVTVRRPATLLLGEDVFEGVRGEEVEVHGTFTDNEQGTPPEATGRPIALDTRVRIAWGHEDVRDKTAFVDPATGAFRVLLPIPEDHPLTPEPVPVTVTYDPAPGAFYTAGEAEARGRIATDTTISLAPASVPRGTDAVIAGTLRDDQDAPVPDQPVTVTWDGATNLTATTDADGAFEAVRPVPADAQPRSVPVRASFAGSEDLVYRTSSAGPVDYAVVASTVLEVGDLQLLRGPIELPGTLRDDHGDPVQGAVRVTLVDGGGEVLTAQALAGADGAFAIPAELPRETPLGAYRAVYEYGGEPPFLLPSTAEADVHVVAATHLNLEALEFLVRGRPLQLSGLLLDDTGSPVSGQIVEVGLDDRALGQSTTVEGRFVVDVLVPHVTPGEHTLTLRFAGTADLLPTQTNVTVIVKAATHLDLQLPAVVDADGNLVADGVLTDDTGEPVTEQEVCVQTRAGKRFERPVCFRTDEEGAFRFKKPVAGDEDAPVIVGAQFNGSRLLLSSTFGEGVVTVRASDSLAWLPWVATAGAVAAAVGGLAALWWFLLRRRSALRSIHDILQDVIYDLGVADAGSEAIIAAYERLERTLRRHGYLRRRHETVREFEAALVSALKLPAGLLDDFLGLFETARYSQHAISAATRDEAASMFGRVDRHVQGALRRVGPASAESEVPA